MAAASASLHFYSNSRFSSFCCSKSSKTHHFSYKPISVRRFFSSSSPSESFYPVIINKRSSRFPFPRTTEENEVPPNEPTESRKEGDKRGQPAHLNSVLFAYKEAILNGDEKTVSDIESIIYMVEKEKNHLLQKVSTLSAEISSGKDKHIRLQADFDNFRKRSEKERLTIRSDAQMKVMETLLPMVDNFERAKQHIKLETEQEKKIDASYQGIYKQFVEIMKSLRVSVIPTIGKPFDPAVHEAIAREESQEFKEGIIIQEFRRGFVLDGCLLRPAMVKVSSGPGRKKSSPASGESVDQPVTTVGMDER